jgi:hypothetical protein
MSLRKKTTMTQEKISANRANGRRSHGPVTPEGRERTALPPDKDGPINGPSNVQTPDGGQRPPIQSSAHELMALSIEIRSTWLCS